MSYRQFVKDNFHSLGDMPAKEKMKKLGEMWRKHSGKAPMAKKAKGKGLLGDLFPPAKLLGMGMKKQRKAKGKGVVGGEVAGGGILSDTLGALGLGMQKKQRMRKGKGGGIGVGDLLMAAMPDSAKTIIPDFLHLLGGSLPDKVKMLSLIHI